MPPRRASLSGGAPLASAGLSASHCRIDFPGPTTSVGTRTDYSVGSWDYPACATRHLSWSTRELYMFRTV
jgi:hypothetical protein